MYPTKEELNSKWWHRLFKVLFILISILTLIISTGFSYDSERPKATQYNIIKSLDEYARKQGDEYPKIGVSPLRPTEFGWKLVRESGWEEIIQKVDSPKKN